MSGVGDFAASNIGFTYFIYGLAFFSLGLVTSLQARTAAGRSPISRLWLLGGFAFVHGVSEWTELATIIGWLPGATGAPLNLALKVLSFVFLLQFGVEVLRTLRREPGWMRLLPGALLLGWLLVVLTIPSEGGLGSGPWYLVAEAMMRYSLAVPGAVLAAYALWSAAATWRGPEHGRLSTTYFRGAAIALAVYSLVGGVAVPAAPFFPASVLNKEAFEAVLGIPVLVLRTLCAIAISVLLAEAFVVEVSRAQARTVALLQQVDQMREEFISLVAHDLRTPVTVIAGYADMLRDLPADRHSTPLEQQALRGIRTSTLRLDRMVADLLDASRIDARRLTLAKELVDLPALIADVVQRSEAITTGHAVQVEVQEGLPKANADPSRLEQILTNLLSNAAKYSFPDSPIAVTVGVAGREAVVAVTNRGTAIAPEERARIFTRFYRTRGAEAGKVAGLGLGLYITKGLVEAHGGRISFDSVVESPGSAAARTTFRFTLPLAEADRIDRLPHS